LNALLFGLAQGGVYPAKNVTIFAVRSYRTFSPLPEGGLFSAALSLRSLSPAINWHLFSTVPGLSSDLKNQRLSRPSLENYYNRKTAYKESIYFDYKLIYFF